MKGDDFYKNRRFYVYINAKKKKLNLKSSEKKKKTFLKKNPSEEKSPEEKKFTHLSIIAINERILTF